MIILYILLGIIGGVPLLLLLLCLFPVRLGIWYAGEFRMEVRYLWLRFPIEPSEEAEEAESPAGEPEEPEKSSVRRLKSSLKRQGLEGFLQSLGELIKLACRAVGGVFRRLKLRRFDLYLCLPGKNDPAAAAIMYGQVAGGVYSACGGLFGLMPCKKKGVSVDLDYSAGESEISFEAGLSILPIFVVKELVVLVFKGWKPLKRLL